MTSRRQRLLGLAKSTRNNISDSVSSLASGVTSRFNDPLYDEFGNLNYPKDTTITLFPAYTRFEKKRTGINSNDPDHDNEHPLGNNFAHDDQYHIDVKGWLSCPGLMTRKNRLILSLARQITKFNNNDAAVHAIDKLESETLSDDSDSNFISESSIDDFTINLTSPSSLSQDELIKERLANFIARSIPNAELSVIIGSHEKSFEPFVQNVITDSNGHFDICVKVPYKPSVVQVKTSTDDTIFSFQDIMLVPNEGIGLISDIDDTVKMTGVIGDKRELLSTLLLKEVSSWKIPSVISWYDDLSKEQSISFHYVSNSPWQLFGTIKQYFTESKLPPGSVHLKQYTGNIISALMEPSSSRKKKTLSRIIDDFELKKFICVGDSGEHDLEAYVDLANKYPNRIAAIYIRYVENSLSDIDDSKIWWEIEKILNDYDTKLTVSDLEELADESVSDLIDLSDSPVLSPKSIERESKLPPIIPKKPQALKGTQLHRKPPPELALQRSHTESDLILSSDDEGPPPLPRRSSTLIDLLTKTKLSKIPGFKLTPEQLEELEDTDPRGAAWIRRALESVQLLQGTNTKLKLFKDDEAEFFKTSVKLLNDHYRNKA